MFVWVFRGPAGGGGGGNRCCCANFPDFSCPVFHILNAYYICKHDTLDIREPKVKSRSLKTPDSPRVCPFMLNLLIANYVNTCS